jgi:hypothetical protein
MALLVVGAAHAQQAGYTWSGTGTNVAGATKCDRYKMKIDLTVNGNVVKGVFQQEGRPERHFEATAAAGGVFKTKAKLDGGTTMDVSGTIKDGANKILLDGYCKFGGPLKKL